MFSGVTLQLPKYFVARTQWKQKIDYEISRGLHCELACVRAAINSLQL